MKLKLDENLPESLLAELTALGQDVDNVGALLCVVDGSQAAGAASAGLIGLDVRE